MNLVVVGGCVYGIEIAGLTIGGMVFAFHLHTIAKETRWRSSWFTSR